MWWCNITRVNKNLKKQSKKTSGQEPWKDRKTENYNFANKNILVSLLFNITIIIIVLIETCDRWKGNKMKYEYVYNVYTQE